MASALLDCFLQPLVQTCRSYFKNSIEFINRIESTHFPTHCQLVTLDMRRAYTDHPLPYLPTLPVLLLLLEYVLRNNVFSSGNCMYQQLHGIAMGTKLALALATLYLAQIEEHFLSTYTHTPDVWLRYIDDIFMVWSHSGEHLTDFILQLNTLKP